MGKSKYLICEISEFSIQRMNPDSVQPASQVDDPQLSINAFDKHQDAIRQALSRIGDILHSLSNSNQYQFLKGKIGLEDQNITKMKIIRIVKNGINYDVYISFTINNESEYWGVVKNILSNPDVYSEVFKDNDLVQTKEWIIKTKGLILKVLKRFLKPESGKWRLCNDELICYSLETGKMMKVTKGAEIDVLKCYDNTIFIKYENVQYSLQGDNYIYFNYWFEKVHDESLAV